VLRAARRRPVPVCVVRPVPARLDDRGSQPTGWPPSGPPGRRPARRPASTPR